LKITPAERARLRHAQPGRIKESQQSLVARVRLHGNQSLNTHLVQELLTHGGVVSGQVNADSNVGAVADPLAESEKAADGCERPPYLNTRQPRPGQPDREAFQVQCGGFDHGLSHPAEQPSNIAFVATPGQRALLAEEPEFDHIGVGEGACDTGVASPHNRRYGVFESVLSNGPDDDRT